MSDYIASYHWVRGKKIIQVVNGIKFLMKLEMKAALENTKTANKSQIHIQTHRQIKSLKYS
jgi:hypothetical protein